MNPLRAHLVLISPDEAIGRLRELLPAEITITTGDDGRDVPDHPESIDILVAGRPSRDLLDACTGLRALVVPWAGLPAETRERVREQRPGLPVHNLHHNAAPTAELAVALLLAAARRIVPADRALRRGDWSPRYEPAPVLDLTGSSALVLGWGAVGRRIGRMCRGLGMDVTGIRRRAEPDETDDGIPVLPPGDLEGRLPQTRALLLALPLTGSTRALIGARELGLLPEGSVLVNVGRGAVVDEDALFEALDSGRISAGLDVWYRYPSSEAQRTATFPGHREFHLLDNVVLSPHRGGMGGRPEVERLRMEALARTLTAAARGEPLPHPVDLEEGY